MVIIRRRKPEQLLQIELSRRRGQEILPAHDLRDARLRIVRHHGKLIGIDAVGAPYDKVAAVMRQILAVHTLNAVPERSVPVRHTQPPRGAARLFCTLRRCQSAARPGVDHIAVGGMRRRRRVELTARAVAGIDPPQRLQPRKLRAVGLRSPALRGLLTIPVEPQPRKVALELLGVFWAAAVRVEILDAQHHLSARTAHG